MSRDRSDMLVPAGNPHLHALLGRLWDENAGPFRQVLFAHRNLLFPTIEGLEVPIPLLFFGRQVSPNADQVIAIAAENRTASQELLLSRYEARESGLPSDLTQLFALLALRLVERNEHLHRLLDDQKVNWGAVGAALSKDELNTEIFGEIKAAIDSSTSDDRLDEQLLAVLRSYGGQLRNLVAKGEATRLARGLDLSANLMPFYALGAQRLSQLLQARRTNPDEYQLVLQDLYLRRLASNVETTYWCGICLDDPCVLNSVGRLAPEQLELACPKCGALMNVATMYELDDQLRDAILSKDGLLGVAIAWLLDKRKVPYATGTYAGDQELDFLVGTRGNSVLVEVKMHKTHKDEETTERNLRSDFKQALRHLDAVRADGTAAREAWVVTNFGDNIDVLRKKVAQHYQAESRERPVRILCAHEFPALLDSENLAG